MRLISIVQVLAIDNYVNELRNRFIVDARYNSSILSTISFEYFCENFVSVLQVLTVNIHFFEL